MTYVFIAIIAQSMAAILGKYAAISYMGIYRYINIFYIGSLFSLGVQAIVWQQALKKYELSKIYPFMSMVLIIVSIFAFYIFDENIDLKKICGIALICIGCFFLGRESDK